MPSSTPVRIGIIGCGNISGIYLKNCKRFGSLEVVACADLDESRARQRADEFGVPKACSVDDLFADDSIEIVLNLTTPNAHAEIALGAVQAGKSVYNEKPITIRRRDARKLLELARKRGVLVGAGPDTFLGAGLQTCCEIVDAAGGAESENSIGRPVAATAFMQCHGHESWHPDPAFYYQRGGGPMFDMGPYYLTALVSLLGPVARVTGSTRISFPTRTITSEPHRGTEIHVAVPTHVAGILDFASGAVGTIVTSFDVWHSEAPWLEIHGSEGSLSLPDPNGFGGPVRIRRARDLGWRDVPVTRPFSDNSRGLGVADMARALRAGARRDSDPDLGVTHRASGELAYHVLEIMHAIHDASRDQRHIAIASSCGRPAPLPLDWTP
jgi:predicted dehydrogenase